MPSPRANYCAAVAEVTGLDVIYIDRKLPLAVGRQYELIFWAKRRIALEPQTGQTSLDRIVQ